jgi:hypothetical protein
MSAFSISSFSMWSCPLDHHKTVNWFTRKRIPLLILRFSQWWRGVLHSVTQHQVVW